MTSSRNEALHKQWASACELSSVILSLLDLTVFSMWATSTHPCSDYPSLQFVTLADKMYLPVFRTGTSNKKGDDSWSTCDYLQGVHEICCQLGLKAECD